MSMKKRVISCVISAGLLLSCFGNFAFAAEAKKAILVAGNCPGTTTDVNNMNSLLKSLDYTTQTMITPNAKHDNVLNALRSAVTSLQAGDTLVFYYSGHGGQAADTNGDESDGYDETLCTDGNSIIDDELNQIWATANKDAKIVFINDACHSGSTYKTKAEDKEQITMEGQLIYFGACGDSQTAPAGSSGSPYTNAIMSAWNGGKFVGNYKKFHDKISTLYNGSTNRAEYYEYGKVKEGFKNKVPFTNATGVIKMGDIDNNGKVDATDAGTLIKSLSGTITLSDEQLIAADVNNNGIVNATDLQTIKDYLIGKITTLPGGSEYIVVYGDANGDNIVNLADVGFINQKILGNVTFKTLRQKLAADVDGNKEISSIDSANIIKYLNSNEILPVYKK